MGVPAGDLCSTRYGVLTCRGVSLVMHNITSLFRASCRKDPNIRPDLRIEMHALPLSVLAIRYWASRYGIEFRILDERTLIYMQLLFHSLLLQIPRSFGSSLGEKLFDFRFQTDETLTGRNVRGKSKYNTVLVMRGLSQILQVKNGKLGGSAIGVH
jgi:hypothetical protein